jgi:phosphate-selective porin
MLMQFALLALAAADPLPADVEWTPGEGVTLQTLDEKFALTLRGRAQLRFDLDGPKEDGGDVETTFQVRRLRFSFQGHVVNKNWRYQVQLAFSNRDTEPDLRLPLRDAFLTYAGMRDLHIRVGQLLKHSLKVQADAGWVFGEAFSDGRPQLRLQTQIGF